MHGPSPQLFIFSLLTTSGVSGGKMPYNTEHLKGFYTERICGTVFTDRCKQISTRIVCGQVVTKNKYICLCCILIRNDQCLDLHE